LVYVEHKKEEVEREEQLMVEIQVTYEQRNPDSFDITDISLIQPPMALASRLKTTMIGRINDARLVSPLW